MPRHLLNVIALAAFGLMSSQLSAAEPIVIGLDADMSSVAAEGGDAIRRGALIAIHELNQEGGVLGRPLELRIEDHRGNPARGVDNIEILASDPNVVAVLGGVHTPVALRELSTIHQHGIPFLVPWAAGTPIIDNGFKPNFAFRLSVRDEYAGDFLVRQALAEGYSKPGLLLERTPWGESNRVAMRKAMRARSMVMPPVEWFHWGAGDLTSEIKALRQAGADVILLVSNAPEGAVLVRGMAGLQKRQRLPIISHWGITGGDFPSLTGAALKDVQLKFLQTFSFFNGYDPVRTEQVLSLHCRLFDICEPEEIGASVGVAHAYDLIHILGQAIELAGSTDRISVRDALESVRDYAGLTRHFDSPFTPHRHDALDATSFQLGFFDEGGVIRPIKTSKQPGA